MIFRRARQARRSALEHLVDTLDSIDDPNFSAAAARIAHDVRVGGARAARVHVADVTPLVADSFGALVKLNPICSALAAYARDGLGVDLCRIPGQDVRRRMTEDRLRDRLAARQQRQAALGADARSRRALARLDTLRSFER